MTAQDDNNAADRLVAAKARQQFESAVDSMDAGTGNRLRLMRREALAASGNCAPRPAHISLIPPPVPVDSTIGAGNSVHLRLNCSATAVVKG